MALAQNYPGGYQQFVNRMNSTAQKLHASNTNFRNVSGVEQYGHVTTVRDLSIIARFAMQNPLFAKMVATKFITVNSSDGTIIHKLGNINELLGVVPGLIGIKTGWTENAGECLVTLTQRQGKSILTVILGSTDRFGESTSLIEWAFANHKWEEIKFKTPLVSETTTMIVEDILNRGSCSLPTLKESAIIHLKLLKSFAQFLSKNSKNKYGYYPFT